MATDLTTEEIMEQLAEMGSPQIKNIYLKHGAKEPFFGVKVGDLKTIQKRVKKNHKLALALYDTGNSDGMYLAGLIADETKMTKADLQHWVENAKWYMHSEYTVAWVAAESAYGLELALEWIKTNDENKEVAGWATLSSLVAIKPDAQLNIPLLSGLLDQVKATIHQSKNWVRYVMNGFVIAVGCYVSELTPKAKAVAESIGKVSVQMGETACKVPFAPEYIEKVEKAGKLGKKKKMARC